MKRRQFLSATLTAPLFWKSWENIAAAKTIPDATQLGASTQPVLPGIP
ncbi:MAG: hypothetical protein L0387_42535 [Acidobacteria bacterium]|nr:hypothetical protein [Acidobacteriota bacterium]MCI0722012.1 hypothetical protein [Acidobacteriota bacterium]